MEKGTKILLAVVLTIILYLSPAHALNCTKFKGDEKSLCRTINPLPIGESDKKKLMKSDLYGSTNENNEPVDFNLNLDEEEKITTSEIYDDNIIIIVQLGLFILINYAVFSFLTKPKEIIKWLRVDY